MPFCTTCGTEAVGAGRFCTRCGAETNPDSLPVPASPEPAASEPVTSEPVTFVSRRFRFHGTGIGMLWLYALLHLLSSVTLGIYSFWGRSEIRRYIAQNSELDGNRFNYHGTGRELLLGTLKAIAIIALLILQMAVWIVLAGDERGHIAGAVVVYAAFLFLLPVAMVGAWRYRFSRTSYRGIRFTFRGRIGEFVKIYSVGTILSFLTLSLYTPILQNNIRGYLCRNTYYGSTRLDYDGAGIDLFLKWVICLVLVIPTMGISLVWYWVERFRYYWNHTTIQGARFRMNVHTAGMVWVYVSNFVVMIVTLFLAYPWTQARMLRYVLDRLTLDGVLSFEQIRQEAMAAGAVGEGFSAWLDSSGVDLGIGL